MFRKIKNMLKNGKKSPIFFVKRSTCEFISEDTVTKAYEKDAIYIVNLPITGIYQTSIVVPEDVPADEVALMYEEEVLEDLGLPMDKEYIMKVRDLETSPSGSREYGVSIIEKSIIEKMFVSCGALKHLDFLIPTPYLYETLFKNAVIDPHGHKVIIYIGRTESFGALFKNGELIYYKTMDVNFQQLLPKFNESSPEELNSKQLFEILSQEGKGTQFESALRRVYAIISEEVDDLIVYVKRLYQLQELDAVYLDNAYGFAPAIYEYLSASYGILCKNFSFRETLGTDEGDMVKALAIHFAEVNKTSPVWNNYTIMSKPKPFLKRDSGKLISLTAAAAVLSISYLLVNYTLSSINKANTEFLQKENRVMQKKEQEISDVQKKLQQNLEAAQKSLKQEEGLKDQYVAALLNFVAFKDKYIQKSTLLIDFMDYLRENRLYLEKLDFKEEGSGVNFLFDVVGKNEDSIAAFVDDLVQKAGYEVNVKEIAKFDDLYESKIEVEVR